METLPRTKKHSSAELSSAHPFFSPSDFAVFDQVDEAILLHHAHTGAIVALNLKARQLYGYTHEDIRRLNITTLPPGKHPYTAEEAARRFREAAGGNPQLFEWKSKTKTSTDFWAEVYLKAISVSGHEFILAITRDITNRKLAEDRIVQQQRYLSTLYEVAVNVMNKHDPDDVLSALVAQASPLFGASCGFIYLQNATRQLLELQASPATAADFLSPAVSPGEGPLGQAWQSGRPVAVSRPPGERIEGMHERVSAVAAAPLKLSREVIGVIGLYYIDTEHRFDDDEITIMIRLAELAAIAIENSRLHTGLLDELSGQRKMVTALQTSENRYRILFDNVHDMIFVVEITPENLFGPIIEANEPACRNLGFSKDELLLMTPVDIVPPEHRDNIRKKMELLCAENFTLFESSYITRSGANIPVEINAHLVYLEKRPYVIAIARDISVRKRGDREIARLDRLNLIGAMAAGIGHEIRNPLTTVRGFLQMMAGKAEFSQNKTYFDLMIQELDRANSIITEFLSLAKNKAVDLKPANLNRIVRLLLPLLEAGAILYNKTVLTDLEDNLPDILIDEKEIRQLILNLVRNGLDAMPPGGALTIRTAADDETVTLCVVDQGRGIAPEIADKIGTPFFTTKEYGVGLGLAVCYSIAARHNATINFETDSAGTTFNVHFKQPY